MHNGTAPGHDAGDQRGICHITFNQFYVGIVQGQVAAFACGHVIQNSHCVALGQQRVNQIGTYKPGAAGDEDRGISHDDKTCPVGSGDRHARREV